MLSFSIELIKTCQKGLKMQIFDYRCPKITNFHFFHRNFFFIIGKMISIANFYTITTIWRVIKDTILKKSNFLLFSTKMEALSIIFEFFVIIWFEWIWSSYNSLTPCCNNVAYLDNFEDFLLLKSRATIESIWACFTSSGNRKKIKTFLESWDHHKLEKNMAPADFKPHFWYTVYTVHQRSFRHLKE